MSRICGRLSVFVFLFIIHHSYFIISSAHAGCGFAQPVVQQNLVVAQFAVPVAVPQYVVPIAPQSYVQYGGGAVMPAPAGRQATGGNDTAEDRIAARILARLTSAGVIKPEAIPSLVSKTCAGCHSGPQPKAGLDLSNLQALSPDIRLKCIGRVLSDDTSQRMPPVSSGKTLSAEELGRLLQEFSSHGQESGGTSGANAQPSPPAAVPAGPAPAPAEPAK
ncbi:MAG TPA: hypothetical protein VHV55_22810 [Pirellulales bacterium]|jgi:hypothetical protein|nr:hypothetical protein [Pirellulales bacterium]